MRHALWFSAFLLAVASPSTVRAEGATPLFRADFDAGASPLFGFTTLRDGFLDSAWRLTHLPAGGPRGAPAVDITMLGVTDPPENYVGWFRDLAGIDVPQGATRYLRMRIRLVSPIQYRSVGNAGSWSTKLVILGDGGESSQRVMWNLRSGPSVSEPVFVIEKNIDGGATRITTQPLPVDTWIAAQLELRSSTTPSSGDARFRLYLGPDNANPATPTYESGSFSISTADWDAILGLGYYCDYMRPGGNVRFQISAFEYDDEFDPTWGNGTPSGDGGAPGDAGPEDGADAAAPKNGEPASPAGGGDPTDPAPSSSSDSGCSAAGGGRASVAAAGAVLVLAALARRRRATRERL